MASNDRKKMDRDRKRQERQALKQAGAPTPGVLDRALCDALRDVVMITLGHRDLRPSNVVEAVVSIRDILRMARRELAERGLDKGACDAALVARLATLDGAHSRSEAKPAPEVVLKPEDDSEAYPEADADIDLDPVQRMLDDLECSFEPEDL